VLSVVLQDLPREHDEVGDSLVSHPVAHSAVLAAGHDEPAPAQTRQVIRDARLRETEVRHQLTHRVLAAREQLKDAKAGGVSESAEVLGERFVLGHGVREPPERGWQGCGDVHILRSRYQDFLILGKRRGLDRVLHVDGKLIGPTQGGL